MIEVTFYCGGCDAMAKGTRPLGRRFEPISGRSHGFGSFHYDTALDVVPEGWWYPCPAGCCYCPNCAADIYAGIDSSLAAAREKDNEKR